MKGLFASFLVPVSGLIHVHYDDITANGIVTSNQSVMIRVKESASSLFYRFESPKNVASFRIKGTWKADSMKIDARQDDFLLRVGFVTRGNLKLNAIERWLAPTWVEQLSEFYSGYGLGQVDFFNFDHSVLKRDLGVKKVSGVRISQRNGGVLATSFDLEVSALLSDVIGLWIQSDGDDSKSHFEITVKHLSVKFRP